MLNVYISRFNSIIRKYTSIIMCTKPKNRENQATGVSCEKKTINLT